MSKNKSPRASWNLDGERGDVMRAGNLHLVNDTPFRDIVPQEGLFIQAAEIGRELGQSKTQGYRVIREINKKLEERGLLTFHGRVLRKAFMAYIGGYEF